MPMEDPKPPVMLCSLIAGLTLAICGAVLCVHKDTSDKKMSAAVAALPGALSQVIRLKQIYSNPPLPEDPSTYPKLLGSRAGMRSPAKNQAKIAQ